MRVGDVSNVAEEHRRAVEIFNRQLVEVGNRRHRHVQVDVVFVIAHLRRARRDDDVGRVERIADVEGGDAVGIKRGGIEIRHHGAAHTAQRCGRGEAGNREELDADEVEAVVEQLAGRKHVAVDVELRDRDVAGVVGNDLRRLDAAWQIAQDGLGHRVDLRDRRADVRAGLEINPQQTNAVDRFGFDMLDAVDRGRISALGDEDDPALDVERGQTRIVPDDQHDRKIDLRENVDVHEAERQDPEHQHQHRHNGDGKWPAKGEANNPHKECRRP